REMLRKLDQPVHATFVYGFDEEIRYRTRDLTGQPRPEILKTFYLPIIITAASRVENVLNEWSKISENFTYDAIFADRDPQRLQEVANRFGKNPPDLLKGLNQVVIESASRRRVVPLNRMFSIEWGAFSPDPRGYTLPPSRRGPGRVQSELTDTLRALVTGESVKVGSPKGIAPAVAPDGPDARAFQGILGAQGFDAVPIDL